MNQEENRFDDIFCDKCDNMLDISISQSDRAKNYDISTPESLSSDDEINYETILKKVEDGKQLTSNELKMIDIKEMVKDEYYKKMQKKGEIKKIIMDMIEDNVNTDENVGAFMICSNCGFNKNIPNGFRILSKKMEASSDSANVDEGCITEASYRNKVYIRTMPCTRNFNCPNKDCTVYKKGLAPEAIFFRKNTETCETIYVCKRCLTIKMN